MDTSTELASIINKCERPESMEKKLSLDEGYLLERSKVLDQYKRLRTLYNLQKSIVRQNMHNAMSPISAISGYLELMNLTLDEDADPERIERYRKKIENGIQELNIILEHLHKTFSEEVESEDEEDANIFKNTEYHRLVG